MVTSDKDKVRKDMLFRRKEQSKDMASVKSKQTQEIVLAQDFWQKATTIALYMPISGEVNTDLLLKNAWANEKTVLLPRCHTHEKGLMDFFSCKSYADLTLGKFNIMEPKKHIDPWQSTIDLIIIPGVAFDTHGYRLGFGAGYYDRFLNKFPHSLSIGLAFSWQIIQPKPIWNNWDMQVKVVISEEGILWI